MGFRVLFRAPFKGFRVPLMGFRAPLSAPLGALSSLRRSGDLVRGTIVEGNSSYIYLHKKLLAWRILGT